MKNRPKGRWNMHHPTEPEWLKVLGPLSTLNSKDVASIFGYQSPHAVNSAVRQGCFPPADYMDLNSYQWKLSTIRAEIKRRLTLCSTPKEHPCKPD